MRQTLGASTGPYLRDNGVKAMVATDAARKI
jgi:hypothetical protein